MPSARDACVGFWLRAYASGSARSCNSLAGRSKSRFRVELTKPQTKCVSAIVLYPSYANSVAHKRRITRMLTQVEYYSTMCAHRTTVRFHAVAAGLAAMCPAIIIVWGPLFSHDACMNLLYIQHWQEYTQHQRIMQFVRAFRRKHRAHMRKTEITCKASRSRGCCACL